jgi:hypothetical protein
MKPSVLAAILSISNTPHLEALRIESLSDLSRRPYTPPLASELLSRIVNLVVRRDDLGSLDRLDCPLPSDKTLWMFEVDLLAYVQSRLPWSPRHVVLGPRALPSMLGPGGALDLTIPFLAAMPSLETLVVPAYFKRSAFNRTTAKTSYDQLVLAAAQCDVEIRLVEGDILDDFGRYLRRKKKDSVANASVRQ